MKNHFKSAEIPVDIMAPGITRQIMGYQSDLMLVKVYFEQGAVAAIHDHPHQQVGYVLKGKFEVDIDGHKEILSAGDAFSAPSGVKHGVVALEEGIIIDTFSPMRADFLK
ncbi:cupin domain-containing protein [candidate division KSB1 bacterium]|nr:cupin domain-containing protein [candidate division KSB1 bacterium]